MIRSHKSGVDHVVVMSVFAAKLAVPVFGPEAVEPWMGRGLKFTGAHFGQNAPLLYRFHDPLDRGHCDTRDLYR